MLCHRRLDVKGEKGGGPASNRSNLPTNLTCIFTNTPKGGNENGYRVISFACLRRANRHPVWPGALFRRIPPVHHPAADLGLCVWTGAWGPEHTAPIRRRLS